MERLASYSEHQNDRPRDTPDGPGEGNNGAAPIGQHSQPFNPFVSFAHLDYVPHEYYARYIAAGFADRTPQYSTSDAPRVYQFDDPVTRHLQGSRYQAKLSEYVVTVCNGYFLACTNAALRELMATLQDGGISDEYIKAMQRIYNSAYEIEQNMRDRIFHLRANSDPYISGEIKAYNDHVVKYEFLPDPRDQGLSDRMHAGFLNYH